MSQRLTTLLHRAAALSHRQTATALEALRARLGRDGLSMDEWNALVGSASHHRMESCRRDRLAGSTVEEAAKLMMEKVT